MNDVSEMVDNSLRRRRQKRLADEIEQTALRLFAERGFLDVTVEEIASASDISPRTFFRYFPTKEDVVLVSQRRRAKRLLETLADQPPQNPAILAMRNALISLVPRDEEERASMLLVSKVLSKSPEIQARDFGYYMSLMDPLISLFAVRLGANPKTDLRPRVMVTAMIAANSAAFQMWLEHDCEGDISAMLSEALDLVEQGLQMADDRMLAFSRQSTD